MRGGSRVRQRRSPRGQSVSKSSTMEYTLSLGKPETKKTAPYGQFTLIRPFVLTGPAGANGFIVQRIDRTINVTVHKKQPETLTTTHEVSSFTSGNVENAADSYYELFVVRDGDILDRDQFQSGQVLRYVATGPDNNPPTSGTITITGTSVFHPASREAVDKAVEKMEKAEGVSTRSGTKFRVLEETWDTFQGTPANGLPFLTIRPDAKDLLAGAASNRLIHKTTVTWTQDGKKSTMTDTTAMGGRRKTIRARAASKSYRKRRIGKATRRSRDRV